jgi:hypothetical protein
MMPVNRTTGTTGRSRRKRCGTRPRKPSSARVESSRMDVPGELSLMLRK